MQRFIAPFLLGISILLWSSLLSADEAGSYYQFLKSVYDQHDQKLNDFLKTELDYYIRRYSSEGYVPDAALLLGKTYLDDDKRDAAMAVFLKIIFVHYESDQYISASEEIKKMLSAKNNFKDSENKILDCISNGIKESAIPDRYYRYLEFIYDLGREKMYEWALGQYYHFLMFFDDYPQIDRVHRWIAGMYAVMGNYKAAMESYNKYENLYPTSIHIPLVKVRKARIMADNLKEFDKALGVCTEVIETNPGADPFVEALFLRAEIKTRKFKDYNSAIDDYRRVLNEIPSHEWAAAALFAIAEINEKKLKAFITAIENYEEITEKYTYHYRAPEALWMAAKLHLKINEKDEAVKKYDSLARLYPNSKMAPDALFEAASICESKLNDNIRALAFYKKLVEQYPNSAYTEKARKRIGKLSNKQGE